jgi:hypothetical protein
MTAPLTTEQRADSIVSAVPAAAGEYGRTFDLHPALYVLTVAGYFAFLAVMGLAFMTDGLILPFAIFITYIAMAFGVPAMWARIAPPALGRRQSWDDFMRDGFHCATGHISGGGATVQILLIPALIVGWAVAVAIIAALV